MTDPRIEAAAKAIGRRLGDENLDEYLRDTWVNLATAALAAADAAAWRPIETAPKDGAHIDLWVINSDDKGHRLTDAYFGPIPHTCGEYRKHYDSCPPEGDFWIDGLFGEQILGEIISWQPLPAPPEKSDAVGGENG